MNMIAHVETKFVQITCQAAAIFAGKKLQLLLSLSSWMCHSRLLRLTISLGKPFNWLDKNERAFDQTFKFSNRYQSKHKQTCCAMRRQNKLAKTKCERFFKKKKKIDFVRERFL